MQPPEAGAFDGDVSLQGGHEALAGGGRDGLTFPVGRLGHAGQFEDGRDYIDDVSRRVAELAVGGDARRPGGDEGRADAAFVHPGLVTAVRGVGGAREARPEAEVGCRATRFSLWVVAAIAHHDLSAGTVIGGEEDEGILVSAHGLELSDDAADLLIHTVDHRGVDGHLRGLEVALLIGEFGPRERAVHFAGTEFLHRVGEGVGRADVTFEGRQRGIGYAHDLLAGETRGAQGFPAGEILVTIFGDVLRQGLQGEVRGDERDVVEERLIGVVRCMVLEALDGVVGNGDAGVIAFLIGGSLDEHVIDGIAFDAEIIAVITDVEGAFEAGGEDWAVDVPLAAMITTVAGRFEEVG